MKTKIRVCIVGLGRAGRFHLTSIKNLDFFDLKYVIDPSLSTQDDIVQNNDFILLEDIEEALVDDELDAAIISPPTQFHFDCVTRFLKAGKHVFTEKPLGRSLAEIQTCFELSAEREKALFLGFQRRYDRNFRALKSRVETLEPVKIIKASSRDNPQPSLDYLKISGNIFHDMLIHDFDMLIFLLGNEPPISVFAYGHAYDEDIRNIPDLDTVMVTLKYKTGLICSIDTSRNAVYGYDQRLEIFGEGGMAIAENERDHTVQMHTSKGMEVSAINESFPKRYKDAYAAEIRDFGEAISEGRLSNVPRDECLLGHLLANAAHQSVETGAPVNFENYLDSLGVNLVGTTSFRPLHSGPRAASRPSH